MRAGQLRHRVTIQQAARVADGAGGATVTWSTFATRWAAVEPLNSDERLRADALETPITHRVRLRWLDGVRPDFRVSHDGRVLEIVGHTNTDERDRELVLMCKEQTP